MICACAASSGASISRHRSAAHCRSSQLRCPVTRLEPASRVYMLFLMIDLWIFVYSPQAVAGLRTFREPQSDADAERRAQLRAHQCINEGLDLVAGRQGADTHLVQH